MASRYASGLRDDIALSGGDLASRVRPGSLDVSTAARLVAAQRSAALAGHRNGRGHRIVCVFSGIAARRAERYRARQRSGRCRCVRLGAGLTYQATRNAI